jgi:O-antigen/teichoic acid export membrane protein
VRPEAPGLRPRSLGVNTAAHAGRFVATSLLSLVLAPIVIGRLGVEAFGVWAVVAGVVQYGAVADLGVTRALARFVALHDAEGDERGVGACLGVGIAVVGAVAVVACAVTVVAPGLLATSLGVDVATTRALLAAAAVVLVTNLAVQVVVAVPIGRRDMVVGNAAVVAAGVLNFVCSVGVLLVHPTLVSYAAANAVAGLLGVVVAIIVVAARRAAVRPCRPSRDEVGAILRFAVHGQVTWLTEVVNVYTDRVVIGLTAGPVAAGAFEVALRAVLAVRGLALTSVAAVTPTATVEIVARGRSAVATAYQELAPRVVAAVVPAFGALAVVAPHLHNAWLGTAPADVAAMTLVLVGAHAAHVLSAPASSLALAEGHAAIATGPSVTGAALNLALTPVLAAGWGPVGVVAGSFVALAVTSVLILHRFHRRYGVAATTTRRAVGAPVALFAAVGGTVACALLALEPSTRLGDLVATCLAGAGSIVLYAVVGARLRVLPLRLPSLPRPACA